LIEKTLRQVNHNGKLKSGFKLKNENAETELVNRVYEGVKYLFFVELLDPLYNELEQ